MIQPSHRLKVRWRWVRRRVLSDTRGATSLEYLLLLAVIVLPAVVVLRMGTLMLVEQFREVAVLTDLPFP